MSHDSCGIRHRATLGLLRAGLATVLCASAGFGQDLAPGDDKPPFRGCGKAWAASRMFHTEPAPPLSAARLEAMAETDVLHNALDIEITNLNPAGNTCTITGSNVITIQSKSSALTEFTFRLRSQFNVTGVFVNGTTPVVVATPSTSTRVVTLDRAYGMDEIFDLTIEYTGSTVSSAFGSIEVTTHSGGIPIVASLSEPYYAYTWWPAKDGDVFLPGDNSDMATLELAVTVPDTFTVTSNGVLQGTDVLPGARKRFRWASNYPIATYLVSFSATEYHTWSVNYTYPGGSMPVEFFVYPSQDSPSNRSAWNKVIDMLPVFGSLFGEYPFINEKYGMYNFPFGGGMEHQTITGQSGFWESVTAHELAHQWWGDLVTCKTWNHIWLNEGFASYAEALWAENKPGSTGLPALKSYLAGQRYTGSGSVYVYNNEVDQLWEIFNSATTYAKGSWVLHMLRHVLGDDNFFNALAAYRAAFQHRAATTEDLQAVCETFYGGNSLSWFFQEWVYGEYAPSYDWGWDSILLEGNRYLLLSIDQTQTFPLQRFTMPIDIVVDGATHVVFNDADTQNFLIPIAATPSTVQFDPDDWILRDGDSEVSYVPGPPKIVRTNPAPGETVGFSSSMTTMTVVFHTDVDASSADFSLVGATTGPHALALASGSSTNPIKLQSVGPLLPDTYTLTVFPGVTALDSLMALDGEVANPVDPASLPSGDGQPGGIAVIQFTVAGFGDIPAVSDWGLVAMTLLILTAGTLVFVRRRSAH